MDSGTLRRLRDMCQQVAVGRILFWIGYQIHPVARAIGFGLTAVPTAVAIVWLTWRLIAG